MVLRHPAEMEVGISMSLLILYSANAACRAKSHDLTRFTDSHSLTFGARCSMTREGESSRSLYMPKEVPRSASDGISLRVGSDRASILHHDAAWKNCDHRRILRIGAPTFVTHRDNCLIPCVTQHCAASRIALRV